MALDHGSNDSLAENARNIPSADSPWRKAPNTPKRAPLGLLPWKSGKYIAPSGSKFGTPSYPSPLDRIRTGRKDRAKQLGLGTPSRKADFESNQSFPGTTTIRRRNDSPEMEEFKRCTLSTLKCDTLNSVSFAAGSAKGSFSESSPRHARSCGASWVYYNFVGGGPTGVSFPTGIQNPNKAILTINAKTTEILMANKMACKLLGVSGCLLCGKLLRQFLNMGEKWYDSEETQLGSSGESVLIAGKVMELVTCKAEMIPVSVWLHRLPCNEEEDRQVIVLEPVNRAVATVVFDKQGTILYGDEQLAALHGYQYPNEMTGLSITDLMPHLKLPAAVAEGATQLPKDVKKQNTTGRTCDGVLFPVTVRIETVKDTQHEELELEGIDASKLQLYSAVLWVFANISGLVTVFPDGSIRSCNNNFALMLFGYNQSQLVGKNITTLIPSFYDDIEFLDTESILLPPLGDDEEEEDEESRMYHNHHPCDCRNDSSPLTTTPRPMNPISKQIELMIEDVSQAVHSLALDSPSQFLRNTSASEPPTRSPSADCFPGSVPTMLPSGSCHAQLNTTTPGDKAMAACFALGTALTVPPLCAWPTPAEPRDGIVSPNRTSEKEMERERLRLPIRSEVGDFCSAKPAAELDGAALLGSPVVEGIRSKEGSTSTPVEPSVHERPPKFVMNRYGSLESLQSIPEGSYFGLGMHKNGSDLEIIYQIKRVELDDGHVLYCLWISRDPEEMGEGGRPYCSLTFQSSLYNTSKLSSTSVHSLEKSAYLPDESTVCDESYETGPYHAHYTTLQQIGKGGFGFVKMAYRNSDKLLVVTKFIRKSEIYPESWAYDSLFDKKMPLEVSLLMTLKHPNIVQVLDVFENDIAYQLVMEKHGSGMDLFEFIDRDPEMDEPLASYIFRQLVSAVGFLHKFNIIHRDLKDENVILDQKFCVKLIDFGSATFHGPDCFYTTFCGTMEYCSPEVLKGNKYRGPELEMWSLGVTLYILMYGEDPFFTLEEKLAARLKPPFSVSQSLLHLLSRMLDPDPVTRCTLDEASEHSWTNQPVSPEKYCFEDVIRATSDELDFSMYYNPDMPKQQTEYLTTSPVKSDRSEGKERRSPRLSNTSDECYEEQDSFS